MTDFNIDNVELKNASMEAKVNDKTIRASIEDAAKDVKAAEDKAAPFVA
jgi:hypothetical protein